jgi:hypothetical protein
MKKLGYVSITMTLAAGAFLAGLAVAGPGKKATFKAFGELTFDDVGGPKITSLTGNYKKGTYLGLMQLPGGFTSPMHHHSGAYEAVQIKGTSTHWLVGEDGTKATKMTPGSYWSMPGKLPHVSSCAAGEDCLVLLIQKSKFDFTPLTAEGKKLPKEAKAPAPAPAGSTTTTTTTTTTKTPTKTP